MYFVMKKEVIIIAVSKSIINNIGCCVLVF